MNVEREMSRERRSAVRAWFRQPPSIWTDFSGGIYEARCINLSATGISFELGHDFPGADEGVHFEAALTAPRLCVVTSGSVVRTRQANGTWVVAAHFDEIPENIDELIAAALSCIDEEYCAGYVVSQGGTLTARGALSEACASELARFASGHVLIDLSRVRHADADGLGTLADACREHGVLLTNCKPHVAAVVRTQIDDELCAPDCDGCTTRH